jgi:hypothetical protein
MGYIAEEIRKLKKMRLKILLDILLKIHFITISILIKPSISEGLLPKKIDGSF